MRERPILFNADMVRAVLDGRKTQTRRIIQERHLYSGGRTAGNWPVHMPEGEEGEKARIWAEGNSPFGAVGDRLWVRESIFPAPLELQSSPPRETKWNIAYRGGAQLEKTAPATYNPTIYNYERWTPSIHMPRWASRITLEITGVRVERLQDISEQDALAEGVRRRESTPVTDPAYCNYLAANLNDASEWFDLPSDSFISLWQSIYGAESWQANPWVWVIEFKRVGDES